MKLSFNLVVKNFLENCKQEKLTKEDLIIFLQEKFEKFKEFKKILNLRFKLNNFWFLIVI